MYLYDISKWYISQEVNPKKIKKSKKSAEHPPADGAGVFPEEKRQNRRKRERREPWQRANIRHGWSRKSLS